MIPQLAVRILPASHPSDLLRAADTPTSQGIYPTLIIVLICLKLACDTADAPQRSTASPLRWWHPSSASSVSSAPESVQLDTLGSGITISVSREVKYDADSDFALPVPLRAKRIDEKAQDLPVNAYELYHAL